MSEAPTAPRRPARGKPRSRPTVVVPRLSDLLTGLPVTLQDIHQAKLRIAPHLWRTALLPSATLSRMTGVNLRLKTENLQRTCSFKARGALNAVLLLTDEERELGVCTFSAGNHGQGLAFAAQLAGVRCTVFLAKDASQSKIQAIKGYGAEVVYGATIGDASDRMEIFQRETGARYISPFGEAAVVAGQGTVGLEILEDFPEVEHIILGVGGGGLAAGVALACYGAAIVCVEPAGWDDMGRSLAGGKIVPVADDAPPTLCDALQTPIVSPITFGILAARDARALSVTEAEVEDAVRFAWREHQLVVEPGGAVALAALLAGKVAAGDDTVAILSGGNIDPALHARIVA